jgi:hypothetical protein
MSLKVDPRRIFRFTCFIIAGLVMMDLVTRWMHHHMDNRWWTKLNIFFDLDTEHNVPSFLSFFQLLLASFTLLLLSRLSKAKKDGNARAWTALGVIFAYLAVDELEVIHEMVGKYIHDNYHTTGVLYNAWIIPAMVIVSLLAAVFLPFLWRLPKRTRLGIMIAGTAYVASAVGGDVVSGIIMSKFPGLIDFHALTIENVVEEAGEMLSIAFFIRVLLSYMRDGISEEVSFKLTGGSMRVTPAPVVGDGLDKVTELGSFKPSQLARKGQSTEESELKAAN